jgi:hypothetical protein
VEKCRIHTDLPTDDAPVEGQRTTAPTCQLGRRATSLSVTYQAFTTLVTSRRSDNKESTVVCRCNLGVPPLYGFRVPTAYEFGVRGGPRCCGHSDCQTEFSRFSRPSSGHYVPTYGRDSPSSRRPRSIGGRPTSEVHAGICARLTFEGSQKPRVPGSVANGCSSKPSLEIRGVFLGSIDWIAVNGLFPHPAKRR